MERFEWKRHKDIFKGVGIYHLTFVVNGRTPLLGRLAIDHDEPRCLPTDLGRAISHDLDRIQQRRPYVRLLAKQLMPDHLHVLLYVTEDRGISIKEIARGMRQGWRQIPASVNINPQIPASVNINPQIPASVNIDPQMTASVNIDPQMASADKNKQTPESRTLPPLFEAPFIRTLAHKGQLDAMIRYIHDNPRRAMLRQQHPDLFVLHRDTRVGAFSFTSLGNLFLLDYPDKQSVICSRSLSEQQIAAEQTAILRQAQNGCVTVTAAISEGERQIARAVRKAGLPLIILLKDGLPKADDPHEKYYKPGGVYFEACAAGQLLLLEPDTETLTLPDIQARTEQTLRQKAEAGHRAYRPLPIASDRYRMMATNEIVKQICL